MSDTEHPLQLPLVVRFCRALATLFAVYVVILFVSTHVRLPKNSLPGNSDKVAHFLAYAVLSSLLALWLSARQHTLKQILSMTLLFGICFGAFDELLQIPVGRDCDIRDWLADVVGTFLGAGLFTGLRYCTPTKWWQPVGHSLEEAEAST